MKDTNVTPFPKEKIQNDDGSLVSSLSPREIVSELDRYVVGQNKAKKAVAIALRNRWRRQALQGEMKNEVLPKNILMIGPTGVGKTETAKAISELLNMHLVRFDMSEYQERHTVAKLIGAPPGYVGYEEGGQLTEKVRRKPYSVILLDEIEKAHPDVFNMLLQVLDDGHLTDSLGRKIDFRNSIIIMTSNVGARQLKVFGTGVGFGTATKVANQDENSKAVIENALKKAFAPEFLNRIDDVVVFNTLEKEDIDKIIDIEMEKLYLRIRDLGYTLTLSETAKDYIAEKGFDKQYGARPLKRAIQKYVEDTLAEEIISSKIQEGDEIFMDLNTETNELTVKINQNKKTAE